MLQWQWILPHKHTLVSNVSSKTRVLVESYGEQNESLVGLKQTNETRRKELRLLANTKNFFSSKDAMILTTMILHWSYKLTQYIKKNTKADNLFLPIGQALQKWAKPEQYSPGKPADIQQDNCRKQKPPKSLIKYHNHWCLHISKQRFHCFPLLGWKKKAERIKSCITR